MDSRGRLEIRPESKTASSLRLRGCSSWKAAQVPPSGEFRQILDQLIHHLPAGYLILAPLPGLTCYYTRCMLLMLLCRLLPRLFCCSVLLCCSVLRSSIPPAPPVSSIPVQGSDIHSLCCCCFSSSSTKQFLYLHIYFH